jgi:hypothetical chaperone protein
MYCGLDFGTSNSTVGAMSQGRAALLPLQGQSATLPSAVFYHEESKAVEFGREAIATYLDGEDGRLMRSIKSVLGTSLIGESTQLGPRRLPLKSVIADFIAEIKRRAETHLGVELTSIVQGRPVHFVDGNDEANRKAEDTLREILRSIGFKHIRFQFEPIAAARHFESAATAQQLALVADIGGGTSDFSVIRIDPSRVDVGTRNDDVLGNYGIRLGGTDFDQQLSFWGVMPLLGRGAKLGAKGVAAPNWIYYDLSSWPRINLLYTPKVAADIRTAMRTSGGDVRFNRLQKTIDRQLGHHIAADVEQAKIALSYDPTVEIDLGYLEAGLKQELTLGNLNDLLADNLKRLDEAIAECLRQSQVPHTAIDLIILTGGSTEMPLIRDAIGRLFPDATIAPCDKFGAVGSGLTLEAHAVFGA